MKFFLPLLIFPVVAVPLLSQPEKKELSINIKRYNPVEKTIFYKLGDRNIPIRIWQYGDVKDIVCINLHSNEKTSVEAAMPLLEVKGGTLIKIENGDQRVIRFRLRGSIYSFDPNRIFSREGIEQTLKENHRCAPRAIDEIEKFAQRLLLLLPGKPSCLIALHNNTDEDFSVRSYLPGNENQFDARAVYVNNLQDVDDIAFTTDGDLYQRMAQHGYNSIWQDNEKARKNGSLSVYCGEKGLRYINIETEHGRLNQYLEMLNKLLDILDSEKTVDN